MRQLNYLFLLSILIFSSCKLSEKVKSSNAIDFKQYYDAAKVNGAFVLYDVTDDSYITYNKHLLDSAFTPASTFKIVNSIISLETGVIKSVKDTIGWDGILRNIPAWNKDSDMQEAFKNSTVWYYQELARRIGEKRMQFWIDTLNYGNKDIDGGIDQFWLSGDLKITPNQQLDFLKRLVNKTLPISNETFDEMEELMVCQETESYTIRAKTGWGYQQGQEVGWFVGYVMSKINKENKTYIFVNLILCEDPENKLFVTARTDIALKIMKDQKVISF